MSWVTKGSPKTSQWLPSWHRDHLCILTRQTSLGVFNTRYPWLSSFLSLLLLRFLLYDSTMTSLQITPWSMSQVPISPRSHFQLWTRQVSFQMNPENALKIEHSCLVSKIKCFNYSTLESMASSTTQEVKVKAWQSSLMYLFHTHIQVYMKSCNFLYGIISSSLYPPLIPSREVLSLCFECRPFFFFFFKSLLNLL